MNPRLVGRSFRISFLLFSTLFAISSLSPRAAQAASELKIGEVAWAGSSLSSSDEWIELWNVSDTPVSLDGYALRGAASGEIIFSSTDIIPAHGTFIVSNYADSDPKSALDTPAQLITTSVSLSNEKLQIELIAPDGTVVNTAGDGGTPPAGSSSPKRSMIRSGDTWIPAETAQNLDMNVPDLATPGFCDGCNAEPADIETPKEATDTELAVMDTESLVDATSTPPEPLVGTSGTEPIITPEVIKELSPVQETAPPQLDLRLHAVFPAPSSGKEWIELDAFNASSLTNAVGWSLKDGSSTIFRFENATIPYITTNGMVWHIELASAHLNNNGDSVELVRPNGSVAERMTYPSTAKDKRWIKNAGQSAWIMDPPDPLPEEAPPSTTASTVIIDETPAIELPIATTTVQILQATEPAQPVQAVPVTKKTTAPAKTPSITVAKKASATAKKATTKTAKKITPVLTPVSFNDMSTLESGVRVRISGVVATAPSIIAKQQFVIVSPDGHGLWIRASNHQPSPEAGTRIQVEGILMNNDDGLYLKLSTKDRWKEITGSTSYEPRVIDLLDPLADDAWSFIQVTGTVTDIRGQIVELDLNGVSAQVKIKPATGYRTARIKKGDGLGIRGVLDTRGETPTILPSSTEDIRLTTHAVKTVDAKTPLPDWLPFGAAGMTLAVTEGAKRLRRVYRDRQLRKRLITNH